MNPSWVKKMYGKMKIPFPCQRKWLCSWIFKTVWKDMLTSVQREILFQCARTHLKLHVTQCARVFAQCGDYASILFQTRALLCSCKCILHCPFAFISGITVNTTLEGDMRHMGSKVKRFALQPFQLRNTTWEWRLTHILSLCHTCEPNLPLKRLH